MASLLLVTGCVTTSEVGECPKRSKLGNDQFMKYRQHHGENAHVQDDLRIAQFCDAIRERSWWDNLWGD